MFIKVNFILNKEEDAVTTGNNAICFQTFSRTRILKHFTEYKYSKRYVNITG